MNIWDNEADKLERELKKHIQQPVSVFLKETPLADIVKLGGDEFSKASEKAQHSIVATLLSRQKTKGNK